MKFSQLSEFVYDKESKALGSVASVDFVNQTIVILTDEDKLVTAKLADVTTLERIGYIGDVGIINHDVVVAKNGKLFEIELHEDGDKVNVYLLDNKMERVNFIEAIPVDDLDALEPHVKLVGNKLEIKPEEKEIDFNICVVREISNGEVTYFYACNNVEKEEIDLIKVIFIGHKLLEQPYERRTLSYDVYLDSLEAGTIKEVSTNELMNYATGVTYGVSDDIEEEDYGYYEDDFEEEEEDGETQCDCPECRIYEDEDEDEDEDDKDYCEICEEYEDDCDCRGW